MKPLYKSIFGNLLEIIFRIFYRPLTRSRVITRCIFNVDIPAGNANFKGRYYWDTATFALKNALRKNVALNQRALEIGTGEFAILAIYLAKKKKGIDLTAVDINPLFVENARKAAKNNFVDINILQSDMFSNVRGAFDVIFWNLPYVPTEFGLGFYRAKKEEAGKKLGMAVGWNGGADGMEIFDSFLKEAKNALKQDGKIIAGLNTFFVPLLEIKRSIKKHGLVLSSICAPLFSTSKAFIITK